MDGGATTVDAFYEFTGRAPCRWSKGFFIQRFDSSDLLNQVWMLGPLRGYVIAPRNEDEAPSAP